MDKTALEAISQGMKCLVEKMSIFKKERFIATVMCEKPDHTKSQGLF